MAEETVQRQVVAAVRIAARPEALDDASWSADATVLRLAADEALLLDALDAGAPEPDAIVFPDMSWVRFVLPAASGSEVMVRAAAWPAPSRGLGQGMVAGIPVKLVVGEADWWFVVPAVVADEFEERLRDVLP